MAITSTLGGYTAQCGRQSGGVSIIGLIAAQDIKNITVTEGAISAITFDTGKCFKKYDSVLDNAEYKFSGNEASIQLRFNRNSAASSKAYNEIIEVAGCGIIAIATMNNGETALLGYTEEFKFARPLMTVEADASSGKAISDANYFDVTLKSSQVVAPLFLADSLEVASLYEPAV